mmetsp:Transcript_118631/g.236278  ORF Transcript_118631/g.236278 Transcript_118631/m.236278 type:complete len:373 (+) Transcript_118631:99-1217(+)
MFSGGRGGFGISSEQKALLHSHNYSLRPLNTVGQLGSLQVCLVAAPPSFAFVICLLLLVSSDLRAAGELLVTFVHVVVVAAFLLYPVLALGVLSFGVIASYLQTRVRWSAVMFWMWWPIAKVVMIILAVSLGTSFGNHLWHAHFLPHAQLHKLQAYHRIDPGTSGIRLQDVGIAVFNTSAHVDRIRTGCVKNRLTYCVAPILRGAGEQTYHDLFMAGTDCCTCPGEFRCGDWNVPMSLGGLRVLDGASLEFFKLAAEDWSASVAGKPVKHPVFFTWSAQPTQTYREIEDNGYRLFVLGLLAGPFFFLLLVTALNGILMFLAECGVVAPLEPPVPPAGIGHSLAARLLPQMYRHHTKLEEQQRLALDPKHVLL